MLCAFCGAYRLAATDQGALGAGALQGALRQVGGGRPAQGQVRSRHHHIIIIIIIILVFVLIRA
jgi:hypothetical protein